MSAREGDAGIERPATTMLLLAVSLLTMALNLFDNRSCLIA